MVFFGCARKSNLLCCETQEVPNWLLIYIKVADEPFAWSCSLRQALHSGHTEVKLVVAQAGHPHIQSVEDLQHLLTLEMSAH